MPDGRRATLLTIAAGGMIGATARYAVAEWIPLRAGAFPWATFWTNVAGSLALGALLAILLERIGPTRYLRPLLATGVLGAFTTMSTFQVETAVLVKDGYALTAVVYAFASLMAGLVACYLGTTIGRRTAP